MPAIGKHLPTTEGKSKAVPPNSDAVNRLRRDDLKLVQMAVVLGIVRHQRRREYQRRGCDPRVGRTNGTSLVRALAPNGCPRGAQ